jgi:histidinol dehydrogenase
MTAAPTAGVGDRLLRVERWIDLPAAGRRAWSRALRADAPDADVAEILDEVRRDGDAALRRLTERFDGARLDELAVPPEAWRAAEASVPTEVAAALEASVAAATAFHADQRNALRRRRRVVTTPGVVAWRRWAPIERAGGYVPGGRAAYASSVVMLGVPARLAGVDELVIATPPAADGSVAPSILYAARLVGVSRVLRVGGAQAIAALAYGPESVTRVDRIFGAGNAWVTAAKLALSGEVAIDLPAGPSECVVLADAAADPELVALDLLAQAEHGPDSLAVLVTDAPGLADAVQARLAPLAEGLATGERALETLAALGRVVLVGSLEEGIEAVDALAAEHVSLQCAGADVLAERVRNAGAIFIGPWSAVAAGDYATGTNHVLPTGGAARAYGGIGVEAFGRWIEVQRVEAAAARHLAETVTALSEAEGLPAHGASVRARATAAARLEAGQPGADPNDLFRSPGPVAAYPAEPSDEALAAEVGLPRVARYDLNTLGGGPLPGVAEALATFPPRELPEYGDQAYLRLREALGALHGVDPGRIVPGAGGDELIRLTASMTLGEGDAAVVPVPTFAMFAVESQLAGARLVEVPRPTLAERQAAAQIRAAAEASSARLVWLCSPNNPTGDLLPLDEVAGVARDLAAIVVVDEVYLDFAEASLGAAPGSLSAVQLQAQHPNLLVLRSLSKSHGLAAARVGYLVVPGPLAERFAASRLPIPIPGPSQALALAALADPTAARVRQAQIVAERERLAAAIAGRGWEQLPSVANFVAFRPPDADELAAALLRRGLAVRAYPSGPMRGWLRATARADVENTALIAALEELGAA